VLGSIHACLREARGRAVYCTMMPNSVSPTGPSPVYIPWVPFQDGVKGNFVFIAVDSEPVLLPLLEIVCQ